MVPVDGGEVMLGTQLQALLSTAPDGVAEAWELVDDVDDGLLHGLGRLDDARVTALARLAGTLAGTPLASRIGAAAEKLTAGSVGDDELAALAGARAALLGSVHDALLCTVDNALGRDRAAWDGTSGDAPEGLANLLAGCRSWLTELAIAGWRGVDHDIVSGASAAIEALYGVPAARRLAVLLDGLAGELRGSSPVASMPRVPVRRWADMWSRALLLSQERAWRSEAPGETVSGRLLILGADVHEHATAVQVQVHGVLVTGDTRRLVRTGVTAAKVASILGASVWRLFADQPVLMGALAGQRALDVTGMVLSPAGDLVWQDDRAQAAAAADPFATARVELARATASGVRPLDRHPVRIAEPVLLEGYKATAKKDGGTVLTLDGHVLAIDVHRLPRCGPLTAPVVARSNACIGLLRWDGGWAVQPLAVQSTAKGRTTAVHTGDWALGPTDPKAAKSEGRYGDPIAVLRERAGRLLRR